MMAPLLSVSAHAGSEQAFRGLRSASADWFELSAVYAIVVDEKLLQLVQDDLRYFIKHA
jgi:hypothetical protein